MSEDEHRLALVMHQSIADGITVNALFPTELITFYEAFSEGRRPCLTELPIQFADYCWWQRQWMQTEAFANELAYWRERLTPAPPLLGWPADVSRRTTHRGAIQPFTFSRVLTQRLNAASRAQGVTLFTTLLASYSALLHRYTGQQEILIGTLAPAGRKRSEVQGLLGYFLNPVPLRTSLRSNPTFRELLLRARDTISGAIANDDVPLECLPGHTGSSGNGNPLFDIVISLAPALPDLGSGWSQTFMDVESGGSRWSLYLELGERSTGLLGRAQYNPDVFSADTITRMLEQWQRLLEAGVSEPEARLSELLLSTIDE